MTTGHLAHSDKPASIEPGLEVLGRRKWLALAVFSAVFGAIVSIALSLPDLYRATATVLVERQQVSEAFVRPSVTAELETRIHTIQQQVMSRARLTELIARFGLYPEARPKAPIDALVARMRKDIVLDLKGVDEPLSGRIATIAFTVSYSGRDPRTVATVANALAGFYVDENTKTREGQAVQTAEFLKAQLADANKELDEQERRASEFKLSHISELPQQVAANLASLERLNTQLRLNGENQIRAMDRRERLEKQLAEAESAAPATTTIVSPRAEQLSKLRQQISELQSHFTDAYPEVVRLKNEMAALERLVADEPSTVPASSVDPIPRLEQTIADVETELRALKGEEVALRQATAGYELRVENVPKRQDEFQAVSRDYDATKERYDTLLKRYEEAQLAESLEQGQKVEQFRVLDPAIPPRDPSAPNRLRLLVVGLGLAIGLAAGAVVAAEKLNTVFHRVDDLRAFMSGSTIIRVPLILTAADIRRARWRVALTAASVVFGLLLIVAGSHWMARGNEQIVRLMERGHV